jgi:hypothetical protein
MLLLVCLVLERYLLNFSESKEDTTQCNAMWRKVAMLNNDGFAISVPVI